MDKTARANAAAPTFESQRVLFPARYHANYGPWVEELIEQCKRFPLTGHFDMADALIGGVLRLVGRSMVKPHTRKTTWRV
jgi:phage terminase large subunit-like protein